jgi:hypothetical protein
VSSPKPRRNAKAEEAAGAPPIQRARPEPKRINVAVTTETIRALEFVIEREGVSLTEAVRRLIGYGEFVYRAIKEDGAELQVRTKDAVREVVLL